MGDQERIDALDGLRGAAALLVFASHAANGGLAPSWLSQSPGGAGVAVFFALSAFLMCRLYARTPFTRANLWAYARRRVGRVVPLYYLAIAVSLVTSTFFWGYPIHEIGLWKHLLMVSGVGVLWTVPVEMQFYLCFLITWWLASIGRPWLGLLALLVVLSGMYGLTYAVTDDWRPLVWMPMFLVGAAVGLWGGRLRSPIPGLGWIAVAIFFLALPSIQKALGFDLIQLFWPALMLSCAGMLVACVNRMRPMQVLATRTARWLGEISFGVYLIHQAVLVAVKVVPLGPAFQALIAVVLTLGLATLSAMLFERPMNRLISGVARRPEATLLPQPAA